MAKLGNYYGTYAGSTTFSNGLVAPNYFAFSVLSAAWGRNMLSSLGAVFASNKS
jgi:hypothetical protein